MFKKFFSISLLILILVGCSEKEVKGKSFQKEKFGARQVKTAVVKRENISAYLDYSGKLEAENIVNITPAIPTKIKRIIVKEGDKVKAGDLLVVMDSTNLAQAKSNYLNMKDKFERMKKLKDAGSIDEQSFEDIETAFEVAGSAYQFALENTEIKAPFAGTVTLVAQKAGENYNQMLSPVLIRIINSEDMKASLQVSDKDVSKIKVGQKAEVKIDNAPEKIFTGKVIFVSPEADNFAGTFLCKIAVKNEDNLLRHNQFVRIRIKLRTAENALVIPETAIVDSQRIFIVQNGKAVEKKVTVGVQNEKYAQIINGISEGEKVVIEGLVGLKNGDPVFSTD